MTRKQAEKLIGTLVTAWTAANGQYVGVLEELNESGRWRGRVRITGVLAPACHWERGRHCRSGFRVGEMIEVGGSSIKPASQGACHGQGRTYREALEYQIKEYKHWLDRWHQQPNECRTRNMGWLKPTIETLEKILKDGHSFGKELD